MPAVVLAVRRGKATSGSGPARGPIRAACSIRARPRSMAPETMFSAALRNDPDPLHVLVVDDDRDLHDDYERCLGPRARETASLREARDELFGTTTPAPEETLT